MHNQTQQDQLVKAYSQAITQLTQRLDDLEKAREQLTNRRMPGISTAAAHAMQAKAALLAEITSNADQFNKPRSRTQHSVKYGMQAQQNTLNIVSEDRTKQLIRQHLPEQAEILIETKTTLNKSELKKLDDAALAAIGITVDKPGDIAFAKPAESNVNKLVEAVLKAEDKRLQTELDKAA